MKNKDTVTTMEVKKEEKITTIKLKEIWEPIETKLDDGTVKFRFEVLANNGRTLKFTVYNEISQELDRLLDNNLLEIISLERKTGKFNGFPFDYFEAKLPGHLTVKREKKLRQPKSVEKIMAQSEPVDPTDTDEAIIWDN